jgi:hypothetical protein
MSDPDSTPRVKSLDIQFASARLKDFMAAKERAEEFLRARTATRSQSTFASVYSNAEYVAFYEFALGYPAEKVRQSFAEAATAALEVFHLRGTMECRVDQPGTKDYSLTNSRDCLKAICMAVIAGKYTLAQQLAELMKDPPKATYVGPDSEVCTANQQSLAYAVKHLFQNNLKDVDKELRRISNRKGEQQVAAMAKMVRGLAQKSDATFNEGLLELLFYHRKGVRRADGPQRFFSLEGVGLSALALRGGLVSKSGLPQNDYLPLELLC